MDTQLKRGLLDICVLASIKTPLHMDTKLSRTSSPILIYQNLLYINSATLRNRRIINRKFSRAQWPPEKILLYNPIGT